MQSLLKKRKHPRLFFIHDDFVARGCLTAIHEAGLQIPQDICLALGQNRGNRIIGKTSYTSIETDPVEDGTALADLTDRCLTCDPTQKQCFTTHRRFIPGESTIRPE